MEFIKKIIIGLNALVVVFGFFKGGDVGCLVTKESGSRILISLVNLVLGIPTLCL